MLNLYFESEPRRIPAKPRLIYLQRLPLTRARKGFFLWFKPAVWWTSVNRYHGFSRVGREKILSPFLEHSEEHVGLLNRFCNILPQDLTPVHVKITRSTNLLIVCRRKLKLSTYLHTISYNHISFLSTRLHVRPSFSDKVTFSVRARKKTMEPIDWRPRKPRFRQTEKNPWRARVSGSRCNQAIAHVRYIKILTWLRGFLVIFLYLVLVSGA